MGEVSSPKNGMRASHVASLAALIACYLTLNSSLNLLNKWALSVGGFRFPFLLTSCHMAFSFLVLAPVALRQPWETHRRTLEKQWRGIATISACMALNIALNNISLLDVSLTLNQIIRSAIPVVTCTLSVVVMHKHPSREEVTALVVLTAGVMLAVWQGTVSGKPYAIAFCIAGTICNGAMMTFSNKILAEKLDVVRLAFYTSPISLACLAPFYWMYERERFLAYYPANAGGVAWIVLVSSSIAVCYNLAHSSLIKRTSAVTTTVLGEIKIIGLLVLSTILLGEGKELTFKMAVGCILAMAGFTMYSHTKIRAMRDAPAAPAVINLTAGAAGGSPREDAPLLKADSEARV